MEHFEHEKRDPFIGAACALNAADLGQGLEWHMVGFEAEGTRLDASRVSRRETGH